MRRGLVIAGGVVGTGVALLAVVGGGGWWWVESSVTAHFDQDWTTHDVDFPVPFPLTEAEVGALREERRALLPADAPVDADPLAGVDLAAIAKERAVERGKHLTGAIFVCTSCHGSDFSGGSMIDEDPIGHVRGPNITRGGRTANYGPRDWDRAVRHGVLPSGKTSVMPVMDFQRLTDRDLSDIVAYIDTMPPKPGSETQREWGPMGKVLIATGVLQADVTKVEDHQAAHTALPPEPADNVEFGAYVTSVCVGCHRQGLEGGPMPFGPPDWPPAANLTPHEQGLGGATYEQFVDALKRGKKRDGTPVRIPMVEMLPYSANWTETELRAAFTYLQSLPPTPTGT